MLFDFANVLVFTALGLGFVGVNLLIGKLLRPANPQTRKLSTYECGEPSTGSAWVNFNIRFYLVALVFIIFEVEIAFVFPVAAVFRRWVEGGAGAVRAGRGADVRRYSLSRFDLRLGQGRPGLGEEGQGLIGLATGVFQ